MGYRLRLCSQNGSLDLKLFTLQKALQKACSAEWWCTDSAHASSGNLFPLRMRKRASVLSGTLGILHYCSFPCVLAQQLSTVLSATLFCLSKYFKEESYLVSVFPSITSWKLFLYLQCFHCSKELAFMGENKKKWQQMTAAMGCVCWALFVQCRCRIVLAGGKIEEVLTQAGDPLPGLQKNCSKHCHQMSGSAWPGNFKCKACWWEMLIHQNRAHSYGLGSWVWQAKEESFHCRVKRCVLKLDGDWELRRLRGHGKPRTSLSGLAQVGWE